MTVCWEKFCARILNSFDSISMVHRYPQRPPPQTLSKLGFTPKPGKLEGTFTWYHNGDPPPHPIRLSFYEMWKGGYGLRADISAPKLLHGQNISLLHLREIERFMNLVSREVSRCAKVKFEARTALTCRIDYATNLEFRSEVADRFFKRYRRFTVARLPQMPELAYVRSLYFGNSSRTIRIYDKLLKEYPDPANSNKSAKKKNLIRLEYMFRDETAVKRFAKRKSLPDHTVKTMISPASIKTAMDEVSDLLLLKTFDPKADFSFKYFYDITKSVALARKHSSFVNAFELLGPNFYSRPGSSMSKFAYQRELFACQQLGF